MRALKAKSKNQSRGAVKPLNIQAFKNKTWEEKEQIKLSSKGIFAPAYLSDHSLLRHSNNSILETIRVQDHSLLF